MSATDVRVWMRYASVNVVNVRPEAVEVVAGAAGAVVSAVTTGRGTAAGEEEVARRVVAEELVLFYRRLVYVY